MGVWKEKAGRVLELEKMLMRMVCGEDMKTVRRALYLCSLGFEGFEGFDHYRHSDDALIT